MTSRGTTLIELVLVLTLLALVMAIGVPRVLHVADAAAVRLEAARLVGALDAGRGAALRFDANAALTLDPDRWSVAIRRGTDTLVAWHTAGSMASGVSLSGAGAPIVFGRSGLAVGAANRTLVVSRGQATRRVVVSRLGRITQ